MPAPQPTPAFTLQIRRTFAAPRDKVFAAWAQCEQLEKWICKDVPSHVVTHLEQDIRTGGRYQMQVRDTIKGETYLGRGIYREVTPPEKIVFTWAWTKTDSTSASAELHPGSSETLVTVEFFDRGGSTEIVLTHATFGDAKDRDEHDRGWNGCLDILTAILQTTSTPGHS
jgi:uncharacterized protein YndB with AHSA1/START domain